jgi:hypothetical protein
MSTSIYSQSGHNGSIEITEDADYRNQLWIETRWPSGVLSPDLNLDVDEARGLRDALDTWLVDK